VDSPIRLAVLDASYIRLVMQSSGVVICTRLEEGFTDKVVIRPYESRMPVILPEVAQQEKPWF